MDAAVMDLSDVFEFGQGYVALSRVRRLTGLYLYGWNERAFQVHPAIFEQDQIFRQNAQGSEVAMAKITPGELKKNRENFIISVGGSLEAKKIESYSPREPKAKVDTYLATLNLWNEGNVLAEIANQRGLTQGTILAHIEKLLHQGKIHQTEIERLVTKDLTLGLERIHEVFRKLSPDKLSPVFAEFQGQYSFDDLRIARMMFVK